MAESAADLYATNLHVQQTNVSSNKITANEVFANYINGVLVEELIEGSGIDGGGGGGSGSLVIQPYITVFPEDDVQAAIDEAASVFASTGDVQWLILSPGAYGDASLELKSGVYMQSFGLGAAFPNLTSLTIASASVISIFLVSIVLVHAGSLTIPAGSTCVLSLQSSTLFTTDNLGIDASASTQLILNAYDSTLVSAETLLQSTGAGIVSFTAKNCTLDGNFSLSGTAAHTAQVERCTFESSAGVATFIGNSTAAVSIVVDHCFSLQNVIMSLNATATGVLVHTTGLAVGGAEYIVGTGTVTYGNNSLPAGQDGVAAGLTDTALANLP